MLKNNQSSIVKRYLQRLGLALALVGAVQGAQATLLVSSSATDQGGGIFHYDFSITNNGPSDVVIVSLLGPAGDPNIGPSLSAPAGFLALYDEVLGFVDFLEASDLFTVGSTLTGFGFDAAVVPGNGFFDVFFAIDVDGGQDVGQVAFVPEPMSMSLLALGLVLAGGSLRGRERGAARA